MDFETILEMLAKYQVGEYADGAYRAISQEQRKNLTEMIGEYFSYSKIYPFGITWLGNCLAVDLRDGARYGNVLLFEIGTGDVFDIPVSVEGFFTSEIIEYADDCLAASFYNRWLAGGGAKPEANQCIGYKVPLFLGGNDDIYNLEVSDLEVYWGLMGQLF